jgi:hypothetical protein
VCLESLGIGLMDVICYYAKLTKNKRPQCREGTHALLYEERGDNLVKQLCVYHKATNSEEASETDCPRGELLGRFTIALC